MPQQTLGGILSQQQQALSLQQRALYDRLRAAGIAEPIARQLALAIAKNETSPVRKRDSAGARAHEALEAVRRSAAISKAAYHEAFVEEAKAMMPSDLVAKIHERARNRAGGRVSAAARKDRQQPSDTDEVSKSDDMVPPKGVQAACKRGLELAPEYGGDGLTDAAKARARSMADGEPVSAETIKRIVAYHARHTEELVADPPSPGYVASLLWGGDAGKAWAGKLAKDIEKGEPVGKQARVAKSVETRIVKAEEAPWKRLVTSVVYEPDTYDSDQDFMDAETIEKACHNFARNGGYINVEHAGEPVGAHVVENWIAPCPVSFGDPSHPHLQVSKGTWLQTVSVDDEALWSAVLDGTFTGFSLEGTALREDGSLP